MVITTGKWINIENQLPPLSDEQKDKRHPKSIRVLCRCVQKSGKVLVKEGYYEMWGSTPCWRVPGSIDSISHWMPLPSEDLSSPTIIDITLDELLQMVHEEKFEIDDINECLHDAIEVADVERFIEKLKRKYNHEA